MKNKGSKLAHQIVAEYRKEKEWKEKAERMERMKKTRMIILAENSRSPIILEEEIDADKESEAVDGNTEKQKCIDKEVKQ